MSDNSDKDKPIDEQLNNENNEIRVKDNEVLDNSNGSKDLEEESQEVKSSDLANPIPSPESESEKRCTSASNAGESEYESADDEELKPIDDNYEETNGEHENQLSSQTNDENCVQINTDSIESESNISAETELKDNKLDSILDKMEEKLDNNCEDLPKDNDLENIEKNETKSSEQLNEDLKSKETESKDSLNDNNNNESEDVVKEVNNTSEKIEEKIEEKDVMNGNDMNEEYVDEEGGHEDIADIEEYEDMDESDECSVDSDNEENEDLKYESIDKENEDLDGEGERQQGDGEESNDSQSNQKDKNLDHDEDKRNPQYIPKRGPFYEHDDRMTESMAAPQEKPNVPVVEVVAEEAPPKPVVIAKKPMETENNKKKTKKKLWTEGDRWGHDLFNEDEQIPKSKDELVNTYGYDIRNEDDPPKARRRRRYGRGPNKYTRQWQDENAYGRARASPTNERNERPVPSERETSERLERNERLSKERSGSERSGNEYNDKYERKERTERKERIERNDRHKTHDRSERTERIHRSEKSSELSHKKAVLRSDRSLNENKRYESEDNSEKRVQTFSTDEFPELPNNDLRKKLSSKQQEVWKSNQRFSGQSSGETEEQTNNEYKTEPMKIIEAIEHNSRAATFGDTNPPNVVRTQTFENSKYSQRRSSTNYEFEEEDKRGTMNRTRSRKNDEMLENSGRAIRKVNNNQNYSNYSSHPKESNDNYRNRNSGQRTERNYHSTDESNRSNDRFYDDDNYRNQRDRESNYVSEPTIGLQKMSIEEKTSLMNRSNESEQTRPKRYSSLRQQQQRIIPENMSNITPNTQMSQTSDTRNISSHQFYDSHTIQTTAYFAETTAPPNPYHPYMTATTADTSQSHPSTYIPQPIPQRYIPQPNVAAAGDASRYMAATVSANVVTAPVAVHSPQIPQPLPQSGAPPPPTVMAAVAPPPPPGTTYISSFPSGYPQFPPAPPPTHVPPGYPGHVPAQQPSPHQLAELYRGGVTYYDPQSQLQQNTIRQIPQRRPKAAIPIVPPPDSHSSDGDGDKTYVSVNS